MNKCTTWVIRHVEVNYLRFVYEPFEHSLKILKQEIFQTAISSIRGQFGFTSLLKTNARGSKSKSIIRSRYAKIDELFLSDHNTASLKVERDQVNFLSDISKTPKNTIIGKLESYRVKKYWSKQVMDISWYRLMIFYKFIFYRKQQMS